MALSLRSSRPDQIVYRSAIELAAQEVDPCKMEDLMKASMTLFLFLSDNQKEFLEELLLAKVNGLKGSVKKNTFQTLANIFEIPALKANGKHEIFASAGLDLTDTTTKFIWGTLFAIGILTTIYACSDGKDGSYTGGIDLDLLKSYIDNFFTSLKDTSDALAENLEMLKEYGFKVTKKALTSETYTVNECNFFGFGCEDVTRTTLGPFPMQDGSFKTSPRGITFTKKFDGDEKNYYEFSFNPFEAPRQAFQDIIFRQFCALKSNFILREGSNLLEGGSTGTFMWNMTKRIVGMLASPILTKVAAASIFDKDTISDWKNSTFRWAAGIAVASEIYLYCNVISQLYLVQSFGGLGLAWSDLFGQIPIPMEDENAAVQSAFVRYLGDYGVILVGTASAAIITPVGAVAVAGLFKAAGSLFAGAIEGRAKVEFENRQRVYDSEVAQRARYENMGRSALSMLAPTIMSTFYDYTIGYYRNVFSIAARGRKESQGQQMYNASLTPDDSQVTVPRSAEEQAKLTQAAQRARNTARNLENATQSAETLAAMLPQVRETVEQIAAETPIVPISPKRTFWSFISDLTNFSDVSQIIGGNPLDLYDNDDELLGSARRIGRMNLSLDQKTDYLIKLYKGDHNKAARAMARLNLV